MANKSVLSLGSTIETFVSQIAAGGETPYSIAVEKGIRFFDGQNDDTGTLWYGQGELEVVIPTLADIVSNPVVLKGVVNSASDIPSNPSNGYLLYIGTTGSYFNPAVACEAGDMAVYYNNAWHVISGENQVTLAGGTVENGNHTVTLGTSAVKVLDVEGKELNLAVAYPAVTVSTNPSTEYTVVGGTVTVASKYISLSKVDGESTDITTPVSISLPNALASDAVTVQSVLRAEDFTWSSGSFPTISKNTSAIAIDAPISGLTVSASGEGDFVTAVSAIKSVSFVSATESLNDLAYGTALAAASGTEFLTGVHVYDSTKDSGDAAFTVWGQATGTFVSGFGADAASGDLVSSITGAKGAVSLVEGSDILTGLSTDGNDVVTSVSFGTLDSDSTKSWFLTGLTEGSEVVTSVSFGSIAVTADENIDSTLKGSAVVSASVSNHVLSFTTGSFMKPVSISLSGASAPTTTFAKGGVKLSSDWSYASKGFTKKALSQADVTISYKNVLTDSIGQSSVSYFYDKAEDHAYSLTMAYKSLSTVGADVTKNGAVIGGSIAATIPADKVAVDVTGGTLPSWSVAATGTGTANGTLASTSLVTSNVSWLAVNPENKDIAGAATWSLEVSDTTSAGAVEVGVADTYDITANSAKITIAAGDFLTDVLVDNSSVKA